MSLDERGYVLGEGEGTAVWFLDTRMTVKAGGAETGGAFTLLEWSAPLGFGPPRHLHQVEDECFYVLDGELVVECGDHRWTAGPGAFVFLPHGVPHVFVVSQGPVRGLQITAPAGFEDFVAELGRPATGPGLPEPSAPDVPRLLEAQGRYRNEIVGPPLTLADVATPG
ncbi:quercetin 2,3-dioxygenase [Geodermatophilus sabuli]|uniref:Cupin domain-containing protein n=1 Tax=Geodermatophilus sabuli TaxID=1564158 RepID=A0A285EG01_9ACTN|nr:quercetin 2,3-dioxygenase [Geodermatophilus sabuli]MBB3083052.1 mannose-6-phosphate isomerase-like protein (cupin superfamily) [Geodermatophilus sabuli]SNX98049.1 Cupin domain-containing protein [Geodermatophilus sabuli]